MVVNLWWGWGQKMASGLEIMQRVSVRLRTNVNKWHKGWEQDYMQTMVNVEFLTPNANPN